MSVLVIVENPKGRFKKSAFELTHYGHLLAKALGAECTAVVLGSIDDASVLGEYGASKVLHVNDQKLDSFDSQVHTNVISQLAQKQGAKVVLINHSANGKSLIGRLAIRLNAGSVSGVNSLASTDGGFTATKPVFAGKAFAEISIRTDVKILSLMGNAIPPQIVGSKCIVDQVAVEIPVSKTKILEVKTVEGTVPLPEAELVVSAGRGMKGPENWGIIEEMATILGATTACSRPVADTGWRPHHEHVGQTGIAIRPNLYIAIGISGAIQHLAGVNSSKVIVVINKDPEAPFFKAADYGVCADLFDVVPRLNEALRKFKANN